MSTERFVRRYARKFSMIACSNHNKYPSRLSCRAWGKMFCCPARCNCHLESLARGLRGEIPAVWSSLLTPLEAPLRFLRLQSWEIWYVSKLHRYLSWLHSAEALTCAPAPPRHTCPAHAYLHYVQSAGKIPYSAARVSLNRIGLLKKFPVLFIAPAVSRFSHWKTGDFPHHIRTVIKSAVR